MRIDRIEDIDTPALLIDLPTVRSNIERAQSYANKHNLRLRPHIKTHKLPEIAKIQLDAGACGINCQKVSEARAIVDGLGPTIKTDVLLTFSIIGEHKLQHLVELAERCTKLTVVADSSLALEGYLKAAQTVHHRFSNKPVLHIMIECDTGGLRAGVTDPKQALLLANLVAQAGSAVRFAGLMTYPAQGNVELLNNWLDAARAVFSAANFPIPDISVGGTPDMWTAHKILGITEMRPGTYVYNDRAIMRSNAAELDWCAQTVLSTVVSKPTPTRVVCDAGSKALSSDLLGLEGHGYILEYPKARVSRLSEEHGVIEANSPDDLPEIGERIRIVPNHACVVTNLFDEAYFIDEDIQTVSIHARGKMQ